MAKKHWTWLLQIIVIGKAREIYIQLTIEQSTDCDCELAYSEGIRAGTWSLQTQI